MDSFFYEVKVTARKVGVFEDAIKIYFWKRVGTELHVLRRDGGWQAYPEMHAAFIEDEHGISISPTVAQSLMDSLWERGLRPTEGKGSAGSLAATERHLKDVQEFSDRLLKMIEKDKERPVMIIKKEAMVQDGR